MALSLPPIPLWEKTFGNSWMKWLVKLRDLLIHGENVQTPTLLNSWTNYDSGANAQAGYWKDIQGQVHIRGLIANGTPGAASVAFTLPEGYRPPAQEIFATVGNNAFAAVYVQTDGDVIIYVGSTTWTSLAGITFKAST